MTSHLLDVGFQKPYRKYVRDLYFLLEGFMKIKEHSEELDLLLETVEKEIEWYDLQLNQEYTLSQENKKKLLKKKYAIISQLKDKL